MNDECLQCKLFVQPNAVAEPSGFSTTHTNPITNEEDRGMKLLNKVLSARYTENT